MRGQDIPEERPATGPEAADECQRNAGQGESICHIESDKMSEIVRQNKMSDRMPGKMRDKMSNIYVR